MSINSSNGETSMDLRDIEYFAVIAEHRHLSRAAEVLGLGQPALSLALRRLERAAEAKLVIRTPKGLELTAVGSALLSHVRRLHLARSDLAREIADLAHGRAGHLRIGSAPAPAETVLPDACSRLLAEAPGVTLNVIPMDNAALLPALRKGDVDLVVYHLLQTPNVEFAEERVGEDRFVVYCSRRHRLAKRKSVVLADLAQERWACTPASAAMTWRSLQNMFAERGLPPPRLALVSDAVTLRHRAVGSTTLIGIGARRAVQSGARKFGLIELHVSDVEIVRTLAVVHREDAYLPAVARRFIELLKDACRLN